MSRIRISRRTKSIKEEAEKNPPFGWEGFFLENKSLIERISDLVDEDLATLEKIDFMRCIYPDIKDIFNAFHLTPLSKTRVVIVGQDPYPDGAAMGLSFSVRTEHRINPSLRNIFKEVKSSYPNIVLNSGNLTPWASQGVLLLNTALTVRNGDPNSHGKYEFWMSFIVKVLAEINKVNPDCIYILWGSKAQNVSKYLGGRQKILCASHPSPMNQRGGFLGCGHFLEINRILESLGSPKINWEIL